MPTEDEVRKALGVVLGRDPPAGIGDEVQAREHLAVWVRKHQAVVTSRDVGMTGGSSKTCGGDFALDVGGTSRTETDGKVQLNSQRLCLPARALSDFPVWPPHQPRRYPQSDAPIFLTSRQTLIVRNGAYTDIAITVFSWGANGNPAKDVSFDWRCFVPATELTEQVP